ncbi:MAG: hypothetical protein LC114_06015 [Bryobacterales bacterium]|nr:hypothetical protein [Bryobacterales bacterium]
MSSTPPPPSGSNDSKSAATSVDAEGRKLWTVGTLTYTTGALAVLFGWLLWGDFAWQLKERSAIPVVQIMLKTFKSSDFLTGLFLATLPALIGIIAQPIIIIAATGTVGTSNPVPSAHHAHGHGEHVQPGFQPPYWSVDPQ